jgi:chaperone modulatory protein CbpM
MISESELVGSIGPLEPEALRRWIDLGWVLPRQHDESLRFDRSDVARVRLICELHYELLIEEDSMSVVLSLMDQLYATRRALGALKAAVEAQPDDVRAGIAAHIGDQH